MHAAAATGGRRHAGRRPRGGRRPRRACREPLRRAAPCDAGQGQRVLRLQRRRCGDQVPSGPGLGADRLPRCGRAPRRRRPEDLLERPPGAHRVHPRIARVAVPRHRLPDRDRRSGRPGQRGQHRGPGRDRRPGVAARVPCGDAAPAEGVQAADHRQPARLRQPLRGSAGQPGRVGGRAAHGRRGRPPLGAPVRAGPVAGGRRRRVRMGRRRAPHLGAPARRRHRQAHQAERGAAAGVPRVRPGGAGETRRAHDHDGRLRPLAKELGAGL